MHHIFYIQNVTRLLAVPDFPWYTNDTEGFYISSMLSSEWPSYSTELLCAPSNCTIGYGNYLCGILLTVLEQKLKYQCNTGPPSLKVTFGEKFKPQGNPFRIQGWASSSSEDGSKMLHRRNGHACYDTSVVQHIHFMGTWISKALTQSVCALQLASSSELCV